MSVVILLLNCSSGRHISNEMMWHKQLMGRANEIKLKVEQAEAKAAKGQGKWGTMTRKKAKTQEYFKKKFTGGRGKGGTK